MQPDPHEVTTAELADALSPSYVMIRNQILRDGHCLSTVAFHRAMQIIGSIEWEGSAAIEVRTSYYGVIVRWYLGNRELEVR
jgi:hypothetical protein